MKSPARCNRQVVRRVLLPMLPWAIGAATALVLLGPAFGRGSLLNLDLVSAPHATLPSWTWGLGPGLPHRVPPGIPLTWLGWLIGGDAALKLFLATLVVLVAVGGWRLASGASTAARVGSALLLAAGPFVTTRLSIGHWNVVAGQAALAFGLPHLLRPSASRPRTVLAASAAALTGFVGGSAALAVVAVGVVSERFSRRSLGSAALVIAVQMPWLLPFALFARTAPDLADAGSFATRLGWGGPLDLVVGLGFWRPQDQVSAGPVGPAIAVVLLGLAGLGMSKLSARYGRRALVVAAIGFSLALFSAVPGVDSVLGWVSSTMLGGPLREAHRYLLLFLVVLAPAVAYGADRLADLLRDAERWSAPQLARSLPIVAALAICGAGLWGAGGALETRHYPESWAAARAVVRADPGPLLALPWNQFLDLSFADGRRVLNPVPDYFGGDVIVSTDPELGPRPSEVDPRAPEVLHALRGLDLGVSPLATFRALGIRWIVVLHEVAWQELDLALRQEDGLTVRIEGEGLTLFEVQDAAHTPSPNWLLGPFGTLPAGGRVVLDEPFAPGWRRGLAAAERDPTGLVVLPAGAGLVWYVPVVAVILGYLGWIAVTVVAGLRLRKSREPRSPSLPLRRPRARESPGSAPGR